MKSKILATSLVVLLSLGLLFSSNSNKNKSLAIIETTGPLCFEGCVNGNWMVACEPDWILVNTGPCP